MLIINFSFFIFIRNQLTKKFFFYCENPKRKTAPFINIVAYCSFCGKKGRNYKFLIQRKPDEGCTVTVNVILKGEHKHHENVTVKKANKRKNTTNDDTQSLSVKSSPKKIKLDTFDDIALIENNELHAAQEGKDLKIDISLLSLEKNCRINPFELNNHDDNTLSNKPSNLIELSIIELKSETAVSKQILPVKELICDIKNRCYIYVIDKPQEKINFKITEKMITELLKGKMIDSLIIDSYISLIKPSESVFIIPSEICTKIITDNNYKTFSKVNFKHFQTFVGIFWKAMCHFVCIYIKYNKSTNTGTFSYIDPMDKDDCQNTNEQEYFKNWR